MAKAYSSLSLMAQGLREIAQDLKKMNCEEVAIVLEEYQQLIIRLDEMEQVFSQWAAQQSEEVQTSLRALCDDIPINRCFCGKH